MGVPRSLRALLVVSVGVLPGTAAATPDTVTNWHVPEDVPTIADAVSVATTWDTITVDADLYETEGPVIVDKDVIIESTDPSIVWPAFIVYEGSLQLHDGTVTTTDVVDEGSGLCAGVAVLSGTFQGSNLVFESGCGVAVYALDSTVNLHASEVRWFRSLPAIFFESSAEESYLSVTDTSFEGNEAGSAYLLNGSGRYGTLTFTNTTFTGGRTPDSGGDVYAYGFDDLTIMGGSSGDAQATLKGGSIYALDTPVTIDGTAFTGSTAAYGGAVYVLGVDTVPTLTIDGASFRGTGATDTWGFGGAIAVSNADVSLTGVRSDTTSAAYGGFLYAGGVTLEVSGTWVWNAVADAGGAFYLDGSIGEITESELCGGGATDGAALAASASETTLRASVVHGNVASYAAIEAVDGRLVLFDDTFAANSGLATAYVSGASVSAVNDIFSGAATGLYLDTGVTVEDAGYNLYWELETFDSGYGTLGGDVVGDPAFVEGYVPGECGSVPWLQPGSPAIDAGHPDLEDPDGSRSDIGAKSAEGEEPDDTAEPDDTGDTAEDTGGSPDADGDGTPDAEDCAPEDPDIHPGADDSPLDDVDQDCDGVAATGVARGGCACDGTGGAPGLVGALAVLVGFTRRRVGRA